MQEENSRLLIVLIGLPGSGKSTWRNNLLSDPLVYESMTVISSDDYIEKWAAEAGNTYKQHFSDSVNTANELSVRDFYQALSTRQNILVDRTNLSRKSRERYTLPAKDFGYTTHGIYFDTPDEVLMARYESRLRIGREVPLHVIKKMIENIEYVKPDEFDKLTIVKYP